MVFNEFTVFTEGMNKNRFCFIFFLRLKRDCKTSPNWVVTLLNLVSGIIKIMNKWPNLLTFTKHSNIIKLDKTIHLHTGFPRLSGS